MANLKDFATGTVLTAPTPATSGNTLTLQSGEGALFPTPPFYANAHPDYQLPTLSNAEKILVTGLAGDVLTFSRAQSPTSAKSIAVGWRISNAVYKDDLLNATVVSNETPGGLVNSSNTAYTVAAAFTPGSLRVYLNGQRLKSGAGNDYTENASLTGFTMLYAPDTGDVLLVDYVVGSSILLAGINVLINQETPTGLVNGSNAAYTVSKGYVSGTLQVYINGMLQAPGTHVTEVSPTAGTFTLDTAPLTGDLIRVSYAYALSTGGNAAAVNGIAANTTPTANQLAPLDSNAKIPESTLPTRHFIQKRMSGTTTVTTTAANIAFDTVDITSGTKLTATGNTIVVGSGVSVIEVSYNLMSDSGGAASYLFSRIRKNGTDMSQQIDAAANQFRATSETRRLSVTNGDIISVAADSGTSTLVVGRQSSFTVEVIS